MQLEYSFYQVWGVGNSRIVLVAAQVITQIDVVCRGMSEQRKMSVASVKLLNEEKMFYEGAAAERGLEQSASCLMKRAMANAAYSSTGLQRADR